MPELPEVETVVRDLRPLLVGRALGAARRSAFALRRPWDDAWDDALADRRVVGLRRRGKWIVVDLDDAARLQVHLGMTGRLTVHPADEAVAVHTHLAFPLDDGRELRFNDARRFGSAAYFADEAALQAFFAAQKLGPEPFDLDPAAWWRDLHGTSRMLKPVLLDQTVVAGVGNIYADEALFEAGLRPTRRGSGVTRAQAEKLRRAIVAVLTRAIERRGSTIRNYVGGSGLGGGYQDEFRVYGRTGEPCPACKGPVRHLRLGGRSSHYCPHCQG